MTDRMSTAQARLTQIKDFVTMNKTATTIPFDPDCTKFPTRKEVPQRSDAPSEAAWVWGKDDNVWARQRLLSSSSDSNDSWAG